MKLQLEAVNLAMILSKLHDVGLCADKARALSNNVIAIMLKQD